MKRAAMLPATQVRLLPSQRNYLALVAERDDVSISEAIRSLIDAAMDAAGEVEGVQVRDAKTGEMRPATLRELLERGDVDPDPRWVETYGDGE